MSKSRILAISVVSIVLVGCDPGDRTVPDLPEKAFAKCIYTNPFSGWEECREYVAQLLPFKSAEWEFLTRLNEQGAIEAPLLTGDPVLQTVLRRHPGLLWKAQNVKRYVPFLE